MVGESGATPARSPPMAGIFVPTPGTPLAPQDATPWGSPMPGLLSSIPRGGIKLPRYNGDGPLDTYLIQVRMAAQLNGWTDDETAIHLALVLEGKALQTLSDLNPEEQLNCAALMAALMAALEQRFGQPAYHDEARTQLSSRTRREGESLGVFATDLRFLTCRGYSSFLPPVQEELDLQAFIRGLHPEHLPEHVHLSAPTTLSATCRKLREQSPSYVPQQGPRALQPGSIHPLGSHCGRAWGYSPPVEEEEEPAAPALRFSSSQSMRVPFPPMVVPHARSH
ncbi:hypothetical protein LDENG_00060900 [Lucifuga dentata]|nr:hypothetical protein LDENG_00060900 [Lucifuga dentata]